MEGIVRELGGRLVVQFAENPGDYTVSGVQLSVREYNGTWVSGVGRLKVVLSVGDIVGVIDGIGIVRKKITDDQIPNIPYPKYEMDLNQEKIVTLLTEIRDLLKEKKSQPIKETSIPKPAATPLVRFKTKEETPIEEYRRKCGDMKEIYTYFPDEINNEHNTRHLERIRVLEQEMGLPESVWFNYGR